MSDDSFIIGKIEQLSNEADNAENELLRSEMQHAHICRMLLRLKKEIEELKKEIKRGNNQSSN